MSMELYVGENIGLGMELPSVLIGSNSNYRCAAFKGIAKNPHDSFGYELR